MAEEPKKEKTPKKFAKEYKKLCDEYGCRISVNPTWIARDDGSWSLVLQTSIGKVPLTNKGNSV